MGYLLLGLVDGNAHIEQVSVHPDHTRQGIGRTLIEAAAEWAAALGVPAMTLTTYRDVPWNAPYYARLGFRRVPEGQMTPGLRTIRAREAARGLDAWPRVAMRRPRASGLA